MVLKYILYSCELILTIISTTLIVRTHENPTTKKCLPSRTFSIGGIYPTSNGSKIHIIFLKAYCNNNTNQVDSAHPSKLNYGKVPALENTFDRGGLGYI
jgi:hypothetical protein